VVVADCIEPSTIVKTVALKVPASLAEKLKDRPRASTRRAERYCTILEFIGVTSNVIFRTKWGEVESLIFTEITAACLSGYSLRSVPTQTEKLSACDVLRLCVDVSAVSAVSFFFHSVQN
jgi:hypothetical protein